MKMQKNERGITLVALVVTIVVLLILAGITIMYVMSDNGVFGKAHEASQNSDAAAVQEAVSTALTSIYPEIYIPGKDVTKTEETDGSITLDLTKVFKANLSKSMTPSAECKITAPQNDASNLEVADFTVTYKGKVYDVTYSTEAEANLKSGTGGVLATTTP